MSPRMSGRLSGTVDTFDAEVGLGEVRSADGTTHPFHCTQIADDSRSIDAGEEVSFVLIAGRHGRVEAASVEPRSV
ncbi:MAG: cold shock domain-containing protein [Acidimicrobiales bacterium]